MKRCWNVTLAGLVSLGLWCGANAVFAAAAPAPASDKPAVEDPNKPETIIVARIGDYTINKAQLRDRLVQEAQPRREYEGEPNRVVTVSGVLDTMLAEKAMALEGRKLGYLSDKNIRSYLERVRAQSLIGLMGEDYIREHMTLTDADVEAQKKADPNLTTDQAKAKVQRAKVEELYRKFLAELIVNRKVKKVPENFAKAAAAYQRLLTQPAKSRGQGIYWITPDQIENELTPAEKSLVLATFEGGNLTVLNWFETIHSIVPPGRPKDLNTVEGVSKFVDGALETPLLVAEAVSRGYDKNKKHLETMRMVEDNLLTDKVRGEKISTVPEPNENQIKAYFEKHAARFGNQASIKIDQIWCKDLATAQQVKEKLAGGAAFEAVKAEYTLAKTEPAHDTWAVVEGVFWDDLRKAEPNSVVGPMKGFFSGGVRWRVVKVLEKKPAVPVPYSNDMKDRVKEAEMTDRTTLKQQAFQKEILAQYPHEVYAEKIKGMDPLEASTDAVAAR